MAFRGFGNAECSIEGCEIDYPHCHTLVHSADRPQSPPRLVAVNTFGGRAGADPAPPSESARASPPARRPSAVVRPPIVQRPPGPRPGPSADEFRSYVYQPSYAAGGGSDLTRGLTPTTRGTFTYGGWDEPGTPTSPGIAESPSPAGDGADRDSRQPAAQPPTTRQPRRRGDRNGDGRSGPSGGASGDTSESASGSGSASGSASGDTNNRA